MIMITQGLRIYTTINAGVEGISNKPTFDQFLLRCFSSTQEY